MKLNPRFSIFTAAVFMLFVSCDSPTDQSGRKGNDKQEFSEYKIVRMRQKDDRNVLASLKEEFESACGKLLKEGWIPAGGVTIDYEHDDLWKTPMAYNQAFYR